MTTFDPPLTNVRVLDLTSGPFAAIGRQLAELGADVVCIEPRAGSADRRRGYMAAGVSLDYCIGNLGKSSVACDLDDPAGRADFESLLSRADILIESSTPDSHESQTLDVAGVHARHPALVILSASSFGVASPLRSWQATDPVVHALSGSLSRSGIPGRSPLIPPGQIGLATSCAQAVYVILLSYINKLKSGRGDHLDFSVLDGACHALDPGFGMSGSAAVGLPANRLPRGRPAVQHMYPIVPCSDGFVRLCILAARQWQAMFDWMGRPAEFAAPCFATLKGRFSSATLIPHIAEFLAGMTRATIETEGQRRGIPVAAVLDLNELMQSNHLQHRALFGEIDIAPGVSAPFLEGMMEIDGHRAGTRCAVPDINADRDAVRLRWSQPQIDVRLGELTDQRPLAGIRVLDLGVIVVGAEQSRLLADQGADVIKVENAAYPDGSRQTSDSDCVSITFAAGHRNKRGLGLNLRDPKGKELFLKLVKQSDVVAANFKPGTLESLGLGYETLSAINPRLIMLNSSAYGASGPWSARLGYGPLVRATAGLTLQWRYEDDPDSFSDASTIYPDHVAGRVGAIGTLALLIRRARTGRGGSIDVAQLDVMLGHMAPQIAANTLRRRGIEVVEVGGRDAPWGVYPAMGEDEWCVVTVRGDADWRRFCHAVGRDDLLKIEALGSTAGRAAQRARIDAAVRAWLATRSSHDAMLELQAAGVPAARMLRVSELPGFPHFAARAFFRGATHPTIPDWFHLESAPVSSERLPDPPDHPAPLLGQHTVDIARTLLDLSDDDIRRFIHAGVLEAPRSADVHTLNSTVSES